MPRMLTQSRAKGMAISVLNSSISRYVGGYDGQRFLQEHLFNLRLKVKHARKKQTGVSLPTHVGSPAQQNMELVFSLAIHYPMRRLKSIFLNLEWH